MLSNSPIEEMIWEKQLQTKNEIKKADRTAGRKWEVSQDDIIIPLEERDVDGYFIYRDDSYIAFTDDLEYSDSDLDAGNEYCYHVTAVYEEGQSGPSNTACALIQGETGLPGDVNGD